MLQLVIYDAGRKFRVFQIAEQPPHARKDVSASYRLVDMVAVDPKDGQRVAGFFFGEACGAATDVDEAKAVAQVRT